MPAAVSLGAGQWVPEAGSWRGAVRRQRGLRARTEQVVLDLELQQVGHVRLVRLARSVAAEAAEKEARGLVDVVRRDHLDAEEGARLLVVAVEWRAHLGPQVVHPRRLPVRLPALRLRQRRLEILRKAAQLGVAWRQHAVVWHQQVVEKAMHVQARLLAARSRPKDANHRNLLDPAFRERRLLRVQPSLHRLHRVVNVDQTNTPGRRHPGPMPPGAAPRRAANLYRACTNRTSYLQLR